MNDDPTHIGLSQARAALTSLQATMATITGQVVWNGKPEIDDDDGGTAGVREPRRPSPAPLAPAAAELVVV